MDFSNFNEIIQFAIDKEKAAARGYASMREKAKNKGLKDLLTELENEENNHKKLLEDITKNAIGEHEIKPVQDLKISDYLVEEPLSDEISFQDLLIYAAKMEQKSVALYTTLRDLVDKPQFIKLFEFLIEQEKHHKLKLETEYDKYIYQED